MNRTHYEDYLSNLIAGFILSVTGVSASISFAAMIFSGDLSEYLPIGIGIALFSTIVTSIIVGLKSSFPGMIAVVQDVPAAVLSVSAAAIVSSMPVSVAAGDRLVTVIAMLALTSLCTGIFFYILGVFKLGSLMRFIPYPVIGGFLAGTGWLLVRGAMKVLFEKFPQQAKFEYAFTSQALIQWLPGICLTVFLLTVLRRYKNSFILPSTLLTAIALFHLLLLAYGISIDDAIARGWLVGHLPDRCLWEPLDFRAFSRIDWTVILHQTGNIVTILIVGSISLLFGISGFELIIERDLDIDQELQAAGIANILIGVGGGIVGYQSVSGSVIAHKLGGKSRMVALIRALLCTVVLFYGSSILFILPKPILGGLLLYIGCSFLMEWIYDTWFTLPTTEYLIIILIWIAISAFGFLEGVGVGTMTAIVLFVVNYSRTAIVKYTFTGSNYHSNVDRPPGHRNVLSQFGDQLYILRLQGFIFFGTADNLIKKIRRRINNKKQTAVRFIVLDFRQVTGLDVSAEFSFIKLNQIARNHNIRVAFTNIEPDVALRIGKKSDPAGKDISFLFFPDLDHGVEWGENQILMTQKASDSDSRNGFHDQLAGFLPQPSDMQRLIRYFEKKSVEQGQYIIRQGESSEDLFFIESGQVTVKLQLEDGKTIRLRTMGPGNIVGEIAMFLGLKRSASVVADEQTVIYMLSRDGLEAMEKNSPEIAAAFGKFIIRLLAERLVETNRTLQAVLD